MLFPKSEVRMVDIWNTVGLRGTGSDEYVVKDLFIPEHHSLARDDPDVSDPPVGRVRACCR